MFQVEREELSVYYIVGDYRFFYLLKASEDKSSWSDREIDLTLHIVIDVKRGFWFQPKSIWPIDSFLMHTLKSPGRK